MFEKRVRKLKEAVMGTGPVVYWMSRDQRAHDNWALLFAQDIALRHKKPVAVVFCLVPEFLGATIRQYGFMLKGLQEVEKTLSLKNIPFFLVAGSPEKAIPEFILKNKAGCLITDFDPLRIKRKWRHAIKQNIAIPFYEIDAHNVVPCWIASLKQEYAAYTIRPKIRRALAEFLKPLPSLRSHPIPWKVKRKKTDWKNALKNLTVDRDVSEVDWITPGEKAAKKALHAFLKHRLSLFDKQRNNPAVDGQSNLSPYLHFGQLSAQRTAIEIQKFSGIRISKDAFLEELIVRRELSDNFCFYNTHYDSFAGFPDWAKKTLDNHRKDRRPYVYGLEQLETALTHDDLWNTAQREMLTRGKMHGYMRMYWAKKILEWTASPEEALERAIFLNDKYELDGRDPNGYTGIAWSIGGVHDRAWNERPVFGKVRYMSYNGCAAKFNITAYHEHVKRSKKQ